MEQHCAATSFRQAPAGPQGRGLRRQVRELAQRRGVRVLLVTSESLDEQMGQILADLVSEGEGPFRARRLMEQLSPDRL